MLVGLFSLMLALVGTDNDGTDWSKFKNRPKCISMHNMQKIMEEAYEGKWKSVNKIQKDFLVANYLLKYKQSPTSEDIVLVQFKDDDTIVFFITGPVSCSIDFLSKKETNFVTRLTD